MGEKTGWHFVELDAARAAQLNPGVRKSYRVKGSLDGVAVSGIALVPIGGGAFVLPLNSVLRKALGKGEGAEVALRLEVDQQPFVPHPELMECLSDEPEALAVFQGLPGAHQRYFSRWVGEAKTGETRSRRIISTIEAMLQKKTFGEMLRASKEA